MSKSENSATIETPIIAKQHEGDIGETIARIQREQAQMALAQLCALAGVDLPSCGKRGLDPPKKTDADALIAAKRKRERRAVRNRENWFPCDCRVCVWNRDERAKRRAAAR